MVSGQWDAIATLNNTTFGFENFYANLTDLGGGSFSASAANVMGCRGDDCVPNAFTFANLSIAGTVAGNQVTVTVNGQGANAGYKVTLTGTVSADGSSMSGTYTDTVAGPGTWIAQKKQPVTGSYTGSFNSTLHPFPIPFAVTASITQGQGTTVSGSAAVTNSPCFTTLTFGQGSFAIGGAFYLVDSTHGVTVSVFPNENGTLNSTSYYAACSVTSGACAGDTGTATNVTRQ